MSGSRPRPATMHDVATHAGVSTATVSRALSGQRPMSPELRERVLLAANTLGYRVNLLGRALRRKRTSSVGLIVPDLDNPFFSSLAQHVGRSFGPSSIDVFTYSADSDLDRERRGVQSFIGRQVDGLVIIPSHEEGSAENITLASESVVTIQFDRRVPSMDTHFVGCDNRHGMKLVSTHIHDHVDLARQPLIYVGAAPVSSSAHERLDGFTKAFPHSRRMLGPFSAEWGQRAAMQLLEEETRSATIVAAADVIALGCMNALQSRGLRVPEDFRVIGFDGVGVAFLAHPSLTTVRQPVEAMTTSILELILNGLDEGVEGRRRSVRHKPELLVNGSSPARFV